MEANHTPGSWWIDDENQVGAGNEVIASVKPPKGLGASIDQDLWNARANLIAAAPELLAALTACAEAMEIQEGREQQRFHLSAEAFVPMWTEAIRSARTAIAKATGAAA